jgi:hypothetical protein
MSRSKLKIYAIILIVGQHSEACTLNIKRNMESIFLILQVVIIALWIVLKGISVKDDVLS